MLDILTDPASASVWCESHRKRNRSIGFVPTMGALHAGHLSLIERSISENHVSCSSIFVNPLQFNDPEDYLKYPQDLQLDYQMLEDIGCDMVFSGGNQDMFPEANSIEDVDILDPGPSAKGLEGEFRPGHLEGVCTVVNRLFRYVGQCRAYFGIKDFQQLLVIKDLADRLGCPEIIACPTVRDENGLALSSRNQLLSPLDAKVANKIYLALTAAKDTWQSGIHDANSLRGVMSGVLDPTPFEVDYADVRDPELWQPTSPSGVLQRAVALIAARISDVRLIDNLRLDSS